MKLEVGEVLSGTLRLVRKIAEGGMGSVWVAEHLVLGQSVAVKFMSRPWASVPSARTRFLREARLTAKIASPHVVRALDCRFSESDEPYLVLELLHGETLEHRVARSGPVSVFELVDVVGQACEALAATHDAGIVHRDVKPENIFLVSSGANESASVKLLDFGVARPRDEAEWLEVDRLPAGTPQYMSPEQMFEPERTDERSDLFSLAAVAYFALTRRVPFDADSLEGLYFAIDGGSFRRPSEVRPELSASLDAWFEQALSTQPERRFQDARTMAAALRESVRSAMAASSATESRSSLELGVPIARARQPRTRRGAIAALSLAAATSLLVWRNGPTLQSAVASPFTEVQDAGVDARTVVDPVGDPALPLLEDSATEVTSHALARGRHPRRIATAPGSSPNSCRHQEKRAESVVVHEVLDGVPRPDLAP